MAEKKSKRKIRRATSNVYAIFEKNQIQEFKEAFNFIDQDRDGMISVKDLKEAFVILGKQPTDDELKKMVAEAPGPISFTAMLNMFADHLNGIDEESVLLNSFKVFDQQNKGVIKLKDLREILSLAGKPDERLTEKEYFQAINGAPIDDEECLNYATFVRTIKRGRHDDYDEDD